MSFDAGDIQARATLDTRPFQASAAKVREEGRKLAQERWNARVGLDTTGAEREADGFKARMGTKFSRPTTAKVTADTTDALLKIKPLTDRLDEIRRSVATARVRLDGNVQARQQLDELDLRLRKVGLITSRPRVSLGGVAAAELQLETLNMQLDRLNRRASAGGSGGGILGSLSNLGARGPGGLGLAVAGGLPLVAPVAGLAAGAASSLLTPTVAAGIGGGLFAKTAASTYKQVATDLKNLTTLQQRYNAATSNKTRATALAAEKKAWADLSPAEQKAVNTMKALDDEWGKFQKALHPQTFKLLSTGADIAAKGLKLLEPDVKAAGNAIDDLAGNADRALSDPFWQRFFGTFLPGQTHRALSVLGTDLGNVGTGLAHLTEKFAPLGQDLERASVRWTRQFERWTEGDGPGKFVDWVEKNGPRAAHDLEDIGKGIGGVLKGLEPLGLLELDAFGPILNFLGNLAEQHPKEVEALGAAYLSVAIGLKAVGAVAGIGKTAAAVGALVTALRSGQGLKGIGGVFKGGGGIGGCCCGPGGTAPTGPGGGRGGGGEKPGNGPGLLSYTKTLAAPLVLTYLATAGGSQDKPATQQYVDSKISQQPVGQQTIEALVHAITLALANANPNANLKLSPSGVSYDQHGAPKLANATQAVAFIEQYGSPAQVTALQKLAKTYPAVKTGLDAYAQSQSGLNRLLVRGPSLLGGVKGASDEYRGALEKLGLPQDEINKKVATYAHALRTVPATVRTTIVAQTAKAQEDLARLLALRHQLAQAVTMHVITAQTSRNVDYLTRHKAGGMINGPGTGTSDSVPAWLSNGEFVLRASAVKHFGVDTLHRMNRYSGGGPVFNPSGQDPSPNAASSSGSSSSGSSSRSSSSSSKKSKGPSKLTIQNAIASLVDYAGLTFVDDLKGTEHTIRSGIKRMIDRLDAAVRNRYLQSDKTLTKQLTGTRSTLVALARQEDIVGKALSNAQSNLANLRGQAASTRSGTLSAYQGLGDVSQLTNVTSVAGILSVEGQQAKVARSFTRNLGLLRKEGLSKTEYNQLLAAGPGAAGNVVGLLAHATPAQVKQLNKNTGLFTGLGRAVGSASANYLFGGRISTAQAEVKRDRALQHDLLHDQRRLAGALERFVTAGLQDKETHRLLKELTKAVSESSVDTGKALAAHLDGKSKAAASHHRSRPSRSNS